MNAPMIRSLVLKDWYLMRWVIVGYIAGGAAALVLCGTGGTLSFDVGAILLVTLLISLSIHVVMQSIVNERVEKTLPFIMSLPISTREYTAAKLLANGLIFLVPWAAVACGAVALILGREALPNGLVPWTVAVLLEIVVSYFFLVGVSLVSESMPWTIVAMIAGNLGFQAFLFSVSNLPVVAQQMKGEAIVWSGPIGAILALEVLAIVAFLGLTFWAQARKRDFI